MLVSIILSDMNRTAESSYGFRSWMLQDIQEPYEVVLNLFNDRHQHYQALSEQRSASCSVVVSTHTPPKHFNISAANNLGLHASKGKYVIIANSDIIYPSVFLRTIIKECEAKNLKYVRATRMDLNRDDRERLRNPFRYTAEDNFDGLNKLFDRRRVSVIPSPWVFLKSAISAIGGFDTDIRCFEDTDITYRVLHYLKRSAQQMCDYVIQNVYGYHVYHEASELYDFGVQARSIVERRRERLADEFDSDCDIVATDLGSYDALVADLYREPEPIAGLPPKERVRNTLTRVLGRAGMMRLYDVRRRLGASVDRRR